MSDREEQEIYIELMKKKQFEILNTLYRKVEGVSLKREKNALSQELNIDVNGVYRVLRKVYFPEKLLYNFFYFIIKRKELYLKYIDLLNSLNELASEETQTRNLKKIEALLIIEISKTYLNIPTNKDFFEKYLDCSYVIYAKEKENYSNDEYINSSYLRKSLESYIRTKEFKEISFFVLNLLSDLTNEDFTLKYWEKIIENQRQEMTNKNTKVRFVLG